MLIEYDEIIRKSDKGVLIKIEGDKYWLPKSQVEINEDDDTIDIPEWLLKEKGL
jgi:hypothetical protein